MPDENSPRAPNAPDLGAGRFPATRWSLIARLKSGDEHAVRAAIEDLCAQYHYPLYCYLRRRALTHHDAEDVLHDFLAKLLRLGSLGDADAQKGRLRAYLCTALQRFLLDWRQSREVRERFMTLDTMAAEGRYERETFRDGETPEHIFDRKWAQALLTRVVARLGDSYVARGKAHIFAVLRPVVLEGGSLRGHDSAALAAALGTNEVAMRKTLSRLMADYREVLRAEVQQTAEDVDAELAYLRRVFAG